MQIEHLLNAEEPDEATSTNLRPTLQSTLTNTTSLANSTHRLSTRDTLTNMQQNSTQNISPRSFTLHAILSGRGGQVSAQQSQLASYHDHFHVIASKKATSDDLKCDPVPYASERRDFDQKYGKEIYTMYGYEFRKPSEIKPYEVRWDYQNGYVRITPFFKALGHGKTVPRRALEATPGLFDLCVSPTGGVTECQGFWVPFDCARALCMKFCYDIRWVLTPLFGSSIVQDCLPPSHPDYEKFAIDTALVTAAQADIAQFKRNYTTWFPSQNTTSNASNKVKKSKKKKVKATKPVSRTKTCKTTARTSARRPTAEEEDMDEEMVDVDSASVSPRTVPQLARPTWTAVNAQIDSVAASSSRAAGSPSPSTLPASVLAQSSPSATSLMHAFDGNDEVAFYSSIPNYVIRSPPPPAFPAEPERELDEYDLDLIAWHQTPEGQLRPLTRAEWIAIRALIRLRAAAWRG